MFTVLLPSIVIKCALWHYLWHFSLWSQSSSALRPWCKSCERALKTKADFFLKWTRGSHVKSWFFFCHPKLMWMINLIFVDHSSHEVLWKHLVPWNTWPNQGSNQIFFPVLMFGGVGGGQGSCWVPGWNHKDTEDTKNSRQCRGLPFHNLSRTLLRTKAKDPGGGNPFISL